MDLARTPRSGENPGSLRDDPERRTESLDRETSKQLAETMSEGIYLEGQTLCLGKVRGNPRRHSPAWKRIISKRRHFAEPERCGRQLRGHLHLRAGKESNASTRRLAVMNLAIRGIEVDSEKQHANTYRNVRWQLVKAKSRN